MDIVCEKRITNLTCLVSWCNKNTQPLQQSACQYGRIEHSLATFTESRTPSTRHACTPLAKGKGPCALSLKASFGLSSPHEAHFGMTPFPRSRAASCINHTVTDRMNTVFPWPGRVCACMWNSVQCERDDASSLHCMLQCVDESMQ